MAGTLACDTIQNGAGSTVPTTTVIAGSAKAWLLYNGSTQTISNSFNVSSVTYNSTGLYTINFTNAMANANYCISGTSTYAGGQNLYITPTSAKTVSSCQLYSVYYGAPVDGTAVSVVINGN